MAPGSPCLFARVQALIERTYARETLPAAERFVIGDAGLRGLHGMGAEEARPMVLLRPGEGAARASLYLPDRLVANLEAHDPMRGLSPANLHDFAAFVEEIDHLLLICESARHEMSLRPVELEMHANVTKTLVLSLFLARTLGRERLSPAERAELRFELFERGDYGAEPPALRQRYRDARRHALRFLSRLDRTHPADRPGLLRAFSRAPYPDKLALCA